jgi:hypothetical protein
MKCDLNTDSSRINFAVLFRAFPQNLRDRRRSKIHKRCMETRDQKQKELLAGFRDLPAGFLLTLPAAQHRAGGSEELLALMQQGLLRKQRGGKFAFVPPWNSSSAD